MLCLRVIDLGKKKVCQMIRDMVNDESKAEKKYDELSVEMVKMDADQLAIEVIDKIRRDESSHFSLLIALHNNLCKGD